MPSPIAEVSTGSVLTATNFNSLPRGYVAAAQKTSNQATISTITDLTSMSVTYSAVNARKYRITVQVEVSPTVNTDTAVVYLTDGSNNQLSRAVVPFSSNSNTQTAQIIFYETASSSASVTRKVRLARVSGTGTFTAEGASDRPAFILVEDMGN